MSAYLARLKRLESEKISQLAPDIDLTKPPKAPFVSFGGTGAGHIEKKNLENSDSEISKKCTKGGLTKPPKAPAVNSLLESQREARRQKVIAMLDAAPGTKRAVFADTESDPHNVILAVAVRAYQQTCELRIPKSKYDAWRLLELVERHGTTTH